MARLAKERLQHTETLLNEVIPVAIWTADAYPFSKTPLSQVTSDKQSQYVSLTDRFDGFTNLQKQYAEGRFLESLTERLELSNIKKEYVEQLENLFKNYDSSQYHPDQWEKLTGIFSAGVSAVEGASDTDAVRLIVERSADEMNGVSGTTAPRSGASAAKRRRNGSYQRKGGCVVGYSWRSNGGRRVVCSI